LVVIGLLNEPVGDAAVVVRVLARHVHLAGLGGDGAQTDGAVAHGRRHCCLFLFFASSKGDWVIGWQMGSIFIYTVLMPYLFRDLARQVSYKRPITKKKRVVLLFCL